MQQSIKSGQGFSILRVADNQQLLDQIQAAPQLSATDSLELATLYKGDPINDALANYLALYAVGLLLSEGNTSQPDAAETPRSTPVGTNEGWDKVEDFFRGYIDEEDKTQVSPFIPPSSSQLQLVPYSGIRLLIRSRPPDPLFYIIAAVPALGSWSNENE